MPLVVWGAATCLSEWLDENFDEVVPLTASHALELGSGTGLLGIYAIKNLLKNRSENKPKIVLTDMESSVSEI